MAVKTVSMAGMGGKLTGISSAGNETESQLECIVGIPVHLSTISPEGSQFAAFVSLFLAGGEFFCAIF